MLLRKVCVARGDSVTTQEPTKQVVLGLFEYLSLSMNTDKYEQNFL